LDPPPPLLDLTAAGTRGRCDIRGHARSPIRVISGVIRRCVEKVVKLV
jgi:hypothetical protein